MIPGLVFDVDAYTQGKDGMGPVVISGGRRDFKWPVPGQYNIKSCFYDQRNHCAIDIAAPKNTPVVASYNGTVLKAVDGGTSYYGDGFGNYVVLQHSYTLPSGTITLYTRYSHLNSASVKEGATVQAGSEIGKVGTTGNSTGNHLDFQILYGNWKPYQTYSIDPYANQLLELPSSLKVTDSLPCGSSYCSLIKELYSTQVSYIGQCTSYSAYCIIKVTNNSTNIKSLPCSVDTDPNSKTIEEASKNDTYTAIGLYMNTAGNLWYQVKTKSGDIGYIYSGDTTYIGVDSDIKVSGVSAPTELVKGSKFNIKGTISTEYMQLTNVGAIVYKGTSQKTGTVVDVNTKSYSLYKSALDSAVEFNVLAAGEYEYVIVASAKSHYAKNAHEYGTETASLVLYSSTFTVVEQTSCSHSYSSVVTKAATCGATGLKTYTCSKCGASYTETIPATGNHTYGSWTTVQAATCTADGTEQRKCTGCSATQTQTVAAMGHNYQAVVIEGTCTEPGKIRYTCENCKHFYEEYTDSQYSQWSESKPIGVDESLIETKTQYRYQDYQEITSNEQNLSGYELISSTWSKESSGSVQYVNNWPSGYLTSHNLYSKYNKTPMTNVETSTTKTEIESEKIIGYLYYHWCRNTYKDGPDNRKVSEVKTSEFSGFHSFYSTVDPSTLQEDTTHHNYVYSNKDCCRDTYWYFCIPVYEQQYSNYCKMYIYGKWSSWSDWSDTVYTASSERKIESRTLYRYLITEAGKHSWDDGVVTAVQSCTEDGIKTYTCSACGAERTERIPATGHNYVSGPIKPSCEKDGYTEHCCWNCFDYYIDEIIPATGHSYGEWETTRTVGCDTEGILTRTCSACGKSETQTIPATGHSYGNWVTTTEAKCTTNGTRTKTCANCGDSQTETIPAIGHSYNNGLCDQCGANDPNYSNVAAQIVVQSKKVPKGREFTVTVEIKNNPGFSYLEVTPQYDSALTLVSVENGDLISDFTKGRQYVWVSDEDMTDDGLLLTFTFSTAEDLEAGNYRVSFQVRTCANYDEKPVNLAVVPGNIEVIDFVYGDATGDGTVDGFDVIRLKKYLANYDYDAETSTTEIGFGADANGDGKVDGFDVIRLKKYLADYDYETGDSSVVLGPQ